MTKKKKHRYNHNACYHKEQRIIWRDIKEDEYIPPCPTYLELWGQIVVQMENEAAEAARISEEKREWRIQRAAKEKEYRKKRKKK